MNSKEPKRRKRSIDVNGSVDSSLYYDKQTIRNHIDSEEDTKVAADLYAAYFN